MNTIDTFGVTPYIIMQLGWIDFSDTDRKKTLGILTMMDEQGAVDEIGIGRIRDAFANIFFPGTSTVMTRAKYFFIVPYAFKEAIDNRKLTNYRQVIKEVEDVIEKDCAIKMIKKHPGRGNGIIGYVSLVSNNWVARKPSSIYWNELRTLGIFANEKISTIESYVKVALANRDNVIEKKIKDDEKGEDQNDNDAYYRRSKPMWNLPEGGYNKQWRKNLSIELTYEESQFLRHQISLRYQDTLFKAMIDNDIRIADDMFFDDATRLFFDKVSARNQHLIQLANKFNILVYLLRLRYNYILSRGENQSVIDRWNLLQNDIDSIADLDIKSLMNDVSVYDTNTKFFLENSQALLLRNNISELDEWVKLRELRLKGQRAKLLRTNEFDPKELVADYWLDYRMKTAKTIVNDILDAEQRYENNI